MTTKKNLISKEAKNYALEIDSLKSEWTTFFSAQLQPVEYKQNDILGKCKTFADSIRKDKDEVSIFNQYVDSLDLKFKSSVSLYHKVITLIVAGTDKTKRSRVTKYTKALTKADRLGIFGCDLANWIKKQGGIDELAYPKSESKAAKRQEESIQRAESYLKTLKPLFTISAEHTDIKEAGYILLVGEIRSEGDGFVTDVLSFHKNDKLRDQVLLQKGKDKHVKQCLDAQFETEEVKSKEDDLNDILQGKVSETKVIRQRIVPNSQAKSNHFSNKLHEHFNRNSSSIKKEKNVPVQRGRHA